MNGLLTKSNILLDDDDTETTDSDDSDITIDQEQVRFVDIATRSSQVRSRIHPTILLNTPMPYCKPRRDADTDDLTGQETVLKLAVIRSDLDSFVHIANLYETLPQSIELPDLMDLILEHDQAQILNEYIRRTGNGIDIAGAQESTKIGPTPIAINDENKIYLGLNVHGKKRVDLAKKNDPNATGHDSPPSGPLLWRAIMAKAAAIVSYLGSEGPLAAYRHYASVHSDSKAIWFKRLGTDKGGELEKWLPSWLGWSLGGIGESPLSTAITSGDLEMVQLVAKLNPKLFSQSMQTEYVTYTTPSIFRTSLSKLLQNQVPWSQSSLIGCGYIGKHQGYRLPPEKQGVTFAEGHYQRVNILCTINSLLIQFYEGGTSTIISALRTRVIYSNFSWTN